MGDLVATPNGYRSLALEGFSEDLNQDGFVDPIGQAVPVVQTVAVPAVATDHHATYTLAVNTVKTVAINNKTFDSHIHNTGYLYQEISILNA